MLCFSPAMRMPVHVLASQRAAVRQFIPIQCTCRYQIHTDTAHTDDISPATRMRVLVLDSMMAKSPRGLRMGAS